MNRELIYHRRGYEPRPVAKCSLYQDEILTLVLSLTLNKLTRHNSMQIYIAINLLDESFFRSTKQVGPPSNITVTSPTYMARAPYARTLF